MESKPGQGSRFYLLPAPVRAGEEGAGLNRPPGETVSARRILLVEDDKKILKLFDKALTAAGFEVTALKSNPLDAEAVLAGAST